MIYFRKIKINLSLRIEMRILIIEDEITLNRTLQEGLVDFLS